MKKTLTIITLLLALSFSAFSSQPVKLGHVNSQELLRLMPELDSAEQTLQRHIREFQAEAMAMQTELENQYNEFQANQNQWSELIQRTRFRAIQDLEQRIQEYQQTAQRELEELRTRLFEPIIEKAHEAIAQVAREHRYTYVFDTAQGVLLFSNDSDDILELVKRKLDVK